MALDYEQTMAEHADFMAEHRAAVRAHEYGKIWELRMAVKGSAMFCRMAKERFEAHVATHGRRSKLA